MHSLDKVLQPVSFQDMTKVLPSRVFKLDTSGLSGFVEELDVSYTRGLRMFVTASVLENLSFSFQSVLDVGADDDLLRRCFPNAVHYWCDQNIETKSMFARSTFQEFLNSSEMFDFVYCGHTIEHFVDQGDKEFIDFLDKKLTKNGLAIVEPLFIQAQPLSVWHHTISNPTDFDGEQVVQDATTNFPGNPDDGMGFGRVYSPQTLGERLLSKNKNLEFELVEIEGMSEAVPDMSMFKYSRSKLNSPLRLLLVKRKRISAIHTT